MSREDEGLAAFAAALTDAGVGEPATPPTGDGEPDPTGEQQDQPRADAEPKAKGKPAPKPKKLKELSSYAKLSDDELYAIEVPSAVEGGEAWTLGKLKDLAREHDDFTLNGLKREQEFRDRESKLLRTEEELRDILSSLPADAIKPELRERLKAKRDKAVNEERQRVLEVITEWSNRDVRTQELAAMVEHLKDNGFPESYLAGVLDHRTLRYIRANMLREQRLAAALEKVKLRKPNTPAKGAKPTERPATRTQGKSNARDSRAHDNFANVLFANQQLRS